MIASSKRNSENLSARNILSQENQSNQIYTNRGYHWKIKATMTSTGLDNAIDGTLKSTLNNCL